LRPRGLLPPATSRGVVARSSRTGRKSIANSSASTWRCRPQDRGNRRRGGPRPPCRHAVPPSAIQWSGPESVSRGIRPAGEINSECWATSFRNRGRLHSGTRNLRSTKWVPLLRLDLNDSSVFSGGAGNDHQVATRYLVRALHHLADWPNGVDDR